MLHELIHKSYPSSPKNMLPELTISILGYISVNYSTLKNGKIVATPA